MSSRVQHSFGPRRGILAFGRRCARPARKHPLDGYDQALNLVGMLVTEQVGPLDRPKSPTSPDVAVRDITVIESNWDEPWNVRTAGAELLDSQGYFVVLKTLGSGDAVPRKAGYEDERLIADRPADLLTPILPRPQILRISPNFDSR